MDALLVIDYQNDFVSSEGKVAKVIGSSALEKSQRLFKNIQKIVDVWHAKEKPVIFIMSDYSTDVYTETFRKHREKTPYGNTAKEGTWGHDLFRIKSNNDSFVVKHFFSGFKDTNLLSKLKDVKSVVICGVNTDVCVFHTAIEAAINGFETFIVGDATDTVRDNKEVFLKNLSETAGVHIVSTETLTK